MWRAVLSYLCCTLLNHRAVPSSSVIRVHYIILLIAMTKFRGYPVDLYKEQIPTLEEMEMHSHFLPTPDLMLFTRLHGTFAKFHLVTRRIRILSTNTSDTRMPTSITHKPQYNSEFMCRKLQVLLAELINITDSSHSRQL